MNDRSPVPDLIGDSGRGNEAAILRAALRLYAERGFNGASMRDIARAAGTSLSNLYNYFPSKARLLAELLNRANALLSAQVTSAVDTAGKEVAEQLGAAVRAYVSFVADYQTAMLIALSEVRHLEGEERAQVVAERDRNQEIFEELVAAGAASGAFTTPYPRDAARSILAMCSTIATWYRPEGRLTKQDLCDQHARYALALLEGGVEND
ncbi:TetR/AcrR family transcriptional regulator [Streptomyces sp. NPDC002790]|uniref:TetR/AcrR family transcriptional regulator n=1 Tax=Streptomyces sp. NPDC002790 TaxID=3154431 RepID=UPI003325C7E1